KGLNVVGTQADCASNQALATLASQTNSNNNSPSKVSPSNISIPSTSFNSPAYVSSSSMSNKFVSNDWCFVDCKLSISSSFHGLTHFWHSQLVQQNDFFESTVLKNISTTL